MPRSEPVRRRSRGHRARLRTATIAKSLVGKKAVVAYGSCVVVHIDRTRRVIFTRRPSSVTWLVTLLGCPLLLAISAQEHRELSPRIGSAQGHITDPVAAIRNGDAYVSPYLAAQQESNEIELPSFQENMTPAPEIEPSPTVPAELASAPSQPEATPISPEVELTLWFTRTFPRLR